MKHPRLQIATLAIVFLILLTAMYREMQLWAPVPWFLWVPMLIIMSGLVGAALALDALAIRTKDVE